MNLTLRRTEHRNDATMGAFEIDDVWECFTHEPPVRTDRIFIPGDSALPAGFYNVSIAWSSKYQRDLPLLASTRPKLDTSDPQPERRLARIGMWIHPGHPVQDSDGLLLVGQAREGKTIARTKLAFLNLFNKLVGAKTRGEAIDLEIV